MKVKTHIADQLSIADNKAKYDEQVKRLIGNKRILAWIMKYTMQEFKEYTIEKIMTCIEGEPEIANVPVMPGKRKPEIVEGLSERDQVPGEGEVVFDIRFFAMHPKGDHIKIIINVEAQKDYYPGYDLVTRAIFYCARMLSMQKNTEFAGSNYDDIKKVYSIWICMDTPIYAQRTITEYCIEQRKLVGEFAGRARYDLMSAIMVCLGKEGEQLEKRKPLHGLLSTLLSEKLEVEEKMEILEKHYEIPATVEMKEGIEQMCNLSDRIEEKGIEQGIEQGQKIGENKFAALTEKLLQDNRMTELQQVTGDEELREHLYKEYGIK